MIFTDGNVHRSITFIGSDCPFIDKELINKTTNDVIATSKACIVPGM